MIPFRGAARNLSRGRGDKFFFHSGVGLAPVGAQKTPEKTRIFLIQGGAEPP